MHKSDQTVVFRLSHQMYVIPKKNFSYVQLDINESWGEMKDLLKSISDLTHRFFVFCFFLKGHASITQVRRQFTQNS